MEIENLRDIAIVTGARVIDNKHEYLLSEIGIEHFGRAKHIKLTQFDTSIVDGAGSESDLKERFE